MALSRDAYKALEDIVGPENISEDPIVLDAYAFQLTTELSMPNGSKFLPRPGAAVLPGSAEEVQAIVKACNKYRIKYKAYSTGWVEVASPCVEGAIQLDLRRMDRILEIDVKNRVAVVEPYVIAATLQAEAMKVGLTCNVIGAGASHSPLASATSGLPGHGPASIYAGHNSENLLGMEWVLPNGDLLRTGSLGSGAGWFCGEGPGPSLRGLARGAMGASGGLGVFTKCAVKLCAWPGPAELPTQGTVPAYNSPLPENFRAYTLAFPSWQAFADSYCKIYDAEIGYIMHRQFKMLGGRLAPAFLMMYTDPTKQLEDLGELVKRTDIEKLIEEMKYSYEIVLAGMSSRDIEYQEKALSEILAETGGWKVAAMAEPAMQRFMLLYFIRLPFKSINFVYAGGFSVSFAQSGTPDFVVSYAPIAAELIKKHQDTGLLVQCGEDSMMGCGAGMGGGTYTLFEQFFFYDPHDRESVKQAVTYSYDVIKTAREHKLGPGLPIMGTATKTKEEHEKALSLAPQPARFHWQWKIKQMLDPNDTGAIGYDTLEKHP